MTNQNPLVALILLTSLLFATGHTNESPSNKSTTKLWQVAQDAIFITIVEIESAKVFVHSIPSLKSFEILNGNHDDKVGQCVGGLNDAMNNVLKELETMKKLDSTITIATTISTTRTLENRVNDVVSFSDICHHALGDVDETIKLMVHRKIEDIVLLTNDVIFRFAELQFVVKVTQKP